MTPIAPARAVARGLALGRWGPELIAWRAAVLLQSATWDHTTMPEWHAPIASFARAKGYRFIPEFAFCRVEAPFRGGQVELWISTMGSGAHRATLAGSLAEHGVVHLRAKAKLVAALDVEVRRKTLLDRVLSRGVRMGEPEFDARYVALGKEDDVRRWLLCQAGRR